MSKPRFREDKTTHAACLLLELAGARMNYMKLIKLLYLIDRQGLLSYGRPITFDAYVSMKHGPVLSRTLDLINEQAPSSYWQRHISPPERYEIALAAECPHDLLSEAEHRLVREAYHEYGHLNEWELVDLLHTFPEWRDPGDSAIPIQYRDILLHGGKTELEAAEILEELEGLAFVEQVLD